MSLLPNRPGAKVKPGEKRTQKARALAVCERVAGGMSVGNACQVEGLDKGEFFKLRRKDEALAAEYEAALQSKSDVAVEMLTGEADDVMEYAKGEGKEAASYVSAFGHKVKVVQWAAEKDNPKKYSPRVGIAGVDGAPLVIKVVEVTSADEQKSAWQKP